MAARGAVQAALAQAKVSSAEANLYGSWSPLVRQIEGWGGGYGTPLPRTDQTFTSGSFGPMLPIIPAPIDQPFEAGGHVRPRVWQFPVGWNLPTGTPGTEGLKLASFQLLRSMAETCSIARTCIEISKKDILSLDWGIKPTAQAAMAMEGDPRARAEFEQRREQALAFWRRPDRQHGSFRQWLNAVLEDMIVLDAIAIYPHPAVSRQGGPFRSPFRAFIPLDGSLVKPLVDTYGESPEAPEPAYQVYSWGLPRNDLMSMIMSGDPLSEDYVNANLLKEDSHYTEAELLYLRQNDRTNTVYGFGPTEQAIMPISITVMRQQWQYEWFRSGSLPALFLDPGPTVTTAKEARQIQNAMNMLGGDLAQRHQMIVLPPGAKPMPQKDVSATDDFDEWVTATVAMCYGLTLDDLGITPKSAGMMSASIGKSQNSAKAAQGEQRGRIPRVQFLKESLFDRVLRDLWGQTDMEWDWGMSETGQNKSDKINYNISLIKASGQTIDEGRADLGMDPLGLPETQVPLVFTATGAVPLATSIQLAQAQAAGTPPAPAGGIAPVASPAQPTTDETGEMGEESPAHQAAETLDSTNVAQSKAYSDELSILKRYLIHGKSIESFVPRSISPKALRAAAAFGLDPAQTVKAVAQVEHHQHTRDAKLQSLRTGVASKLGELVAKTRNGVLGGPQFVDQGNAVMQAALAQAVTAGAADAQDQFGGDDDDVDDDGTNSAVDTDAIASRRSAAQAPFLLGVLGAIVGAGDSGTDGRSNADNEDSSDIDNRLSLYGEALTGGYEEGFGTGASATMGEPIGTWVSEQDDSVCDLCSERDGKKFTMDTLPGWPGDGGFGGPVCEGSVACRCSIEWRDSDKDASADPEMTTTNVGRAQQVSTNMGIIADARAKDDAVVAARQAQIDSLATNPNNADAVNRMQNRDTYMGVPGTVARSKWEQDNPNTVATGDWSWAATNSDVAPDYLRGSSLVASGAGSMPPGKRAKKRKEPYAGGLIAVAQDTGRMLMQQRAAGEHGGLWEYPGGHRDGKESPFDAAVREWQEEIGAQIPPGVVVGSWTNGDWQSYLYLIESEDSVMLGTIEQEGDIPVATSWLAVDGQAPDCPVRPELATFPWDQLHGIVSDHLATKAVGTDANAITATPGTLATHIYGLLIRHYPTKDLQWIKRCSWSIEQAIPLAQIDMARRPGGRDESKVEAMIRSIQAGQEPAGVVIVKNGDRYTLADGYHRTDALKRSGLNHTAAYVASPPSDLDWQSSVNAMQADVTNKRVKALGKAVAKGAELDASGRELALHYAAGWRPGKAMSGVGGKAGDAQALIDWYENGADGGISWGDSGDWQQCVDIASNYMSEDDAGGFCQLRHMEATGETTAEHAAEDSA